MTPALSSVSGRKTALAGFDQPGDRNSKEKQTFTAELHHGVRYSQSDPVADLLNAIASLRLSGHSPSSISPYSYSADNPLRFADPLGLVVHNDSGETIWVKEEETGEVHPVEPGGTWTFDQDGFTVPGKRCVVFKTSNYYDAWIHSDGSIEVLRREGGNPLKQLLSGKKDVDWLTGLWPDDHGWDSLFEKAGVDLSDPECCEE